MIIFRSAKSIYPHIYWITIYVDFRTLVSVVHKCLVNRYISFHGFSVLHTSYANKYVYCMLLFLHMLILETCTFVSVSGKLKQVQKTKSMNPHRIFKYKPRLNINEKNVMR